MIIHIITSFTVNHSLSEQDNEGFNWPNYWKISRQTSANGSSLLVSHQHTIARIELAAYALIHISASISDGKKMTENCVYTVLFVWGANFL